MAFPIEDIESFTKCFTSAKEMQFQRVSGMFPSTPLANSTGTENERLCSFHRWTSPPGTLTSFSRHFPHETFPLSPQLILFLPYPAFTFGSFRNSLSCWFRFFHYVERPPELAFLLASMRSRASRWTRTLGGDAERGEGVLTGVADVSRDE